MTPIEAAQYHAKRSLVVRRAKMIEIYRCFMRRCRVQSKTIAFQPIMKSYFRRERVLVRQRGARMPNFLFDCDNGIDDR